MKNNVKKIIALAFVMLMAAAAFADKFRWDGGHGVTGTNYTSVGVSIAVFDKVDKSMSKLELPTGTYWMCAKATVDGHNIMYMCREADLKKFQKFVETAHSKGTLSEEMAVFGLKHCTFDAACDGVCVAPYYILDVMNGNSF